MEPIRPTHDGIVTVGATRSTSANRVAGLYGKLQAEIGELDELVMHHVQQRPGAKVLMTHPGVGPVTAFATDVFLGDPARFENGKALVSYVGMIRANIPALVGSDSAG
jgi:hypothetical protein